MTSRPSRVLRIPFIALFVGTLLSAGSGWAAGKESPPLRVGHFVVRVPPGWTRLPSELSGADKVGWYRVPADGPPGAKLVFMIMPRPLKVPSAEKRDAALAQFEKRGSSPQRRLLSTKWIEVAGRKTLRISEAIKDGQIGHSFVIVDGLRIYMISCTTEGLPAAARAAFEPWLRGLAISERLPGKRLVRSVMVARKTAMRDYRDMLLCFASPQVNEQFKEWDEDIWPSLDAKIGWAYFFKSALVVFGTADARGTRVSFYHPWSDVALVTVWREGETPTIVHAQVWPGEALRKNFRPPFKTEPAWISSPLYRSAAVLKTAAETCSKLEGPPRDDLPADIRKAGRFGAAVSLAVNLRQINDFLRSPEAAAVRKRLVEATRRVEAGEWSALLSELPELPKDWRAPLSLMPKTTWRRLRPAGFLHSGKSAVLLMARLDAPDQFASFIFRKTKKDKEKGKAWRLTDLRYYAFSVALPKLHLVTRSAP